MNTASRDHEFPPEIEARLVALILGEASDFEREELTQLIEQQPLLAARFAELARVHALMENAGQEDFVHTTAAEDAAWKLSSDKREHLLCVFAEPAADSARPQPDLAPQQSVARSTRLTPTRRKARQRFKLLAFGLGVASCVGGLAAMPYYYFDSSTPLRGGTAMLHFPQSESATAEASKPFTLESKNRALGVGDTLTRFFAGAAAESPQSNLLGLEVDKDADGLIAMSDASLPQNAFGELADEFYVDASRFDSGVAPQAVELEKWERLELKLDGGVDSLTFPPPSERTSISQSGQEIRPSNSLGFGNTLAEGVIEKAVPARRDSETIAAAKQSQLNENSIVGGKADDLLALNFAQSDEGFIDTLNDVDRSSIALNQGLSRGYRAKASASKREFEGEDVSGSGEAQAQGAVGGVAVEPEASSTATLSSNGSVAAVAPDFENPSIAGFQLQIPKQIEDQVALGMDFGTIGSATLDDGFTAGQDHWDFRYAIPSDGPLGATAGRKQVTSERSAQNSAPDDAPQEILLGQTLDSAGLAGGAAFGRQAAQANDQAAQTRGMRFGAPGGDNSDRDFLHRKVADKASDTSEEERVRRSQDAGGWRYRSENQEEEYFEAQGRSLSPLHYSEEAPNASRLFMRNREKPTDEVVQSRGDSNGDSIALHNDLSRRVEPTGTKDIYIEAETDVSESEPAAYGGLGSTGKNQTQWGLSAGTIITEEGKSLPSPYYLYDDKQYFPSEKTDGENRLRGQDARVWQELGSRRAPANSAGGDFDPQSFSAYSEETTLENSYARPLLEAKEELGRSAGDGADEGEIDPSGTSENIQGLQENLGEVKANIEAAEKQTASTEVGFFDVDAKGFAGEDKPAVSQLQQIAELSSGLTDMSGAMLAAPATIARSSNSPASRMETDWYGFVPSAADSVVRAIRPEIPPQETAISGEIVETDATKESVSTFSLHVGDVSFKLAQAALAKGEWPNKSQIRLEEFVNAFDYGDSLPSRSQKVACQTEQCVHPFLQQRNMLRVAMRTSAAGRASQTPLRLTLLLDNSGSMERSDRRQTVRRAFQALAGQLTPADQITLISFARQPRLLADGVDGAQAGQLVKMIDQLPSEGGTNVELALNLAAEKAREHFQAGAQNRVILLTDGAVNLGDASPDRLASIVVAMRDAGLAFDAAGISADGLNDEVLESLTRQGDGRYYLLDSAESVAQGFASQIAGALRPSAKNVKVQVEFNPQRVGRYKLLGFEKHILKQEDFRNDSVDAAEMAAAESGVAMYQFEAKPGGQGDVGSISVRFRDVETGQMVENRWPIPYVANVARLAQSTASIQLATTASLLAAKLRADPIAEVVDLSTLANVAAQLPAPWRDHVRVQQLTQMIEQARQLVGK